MLNVVAAALALGEMGYDDGIRGPRNLALNELQPGYTIREWSCDRSVDKDTRRFFLTKCQKTPCIDELYERANIPGEVEYLFGEEHPLGLTMSYLYNAVSLSLDGDARFSSFRTVLVKRTLDRDGNIGDEECETCSVRGKSAVADNRRFLMNKLLEHLDSGAKILRCANRVFRRLVFCKNAALQLKEMCGREQYFNEVKRHFQVLNDTMANNKGTFSPLTIDYARTESDSTRQNRKFRDQRTFLCPDGSMRVFLAHSKIKSSNVRIYLIADCDAGEVLIGYVGEKLPTMLYP